MYKVVFCLPWLENSQKIPWNQATSLCNAGHLNTHPCVGFLSFPFHSLPPSLLPLGSFSQLNYSPKSFCLGLCFWGSTDYLISLCLRSSSVK